MVMPKVKHAAIINPPRATSKTKGLLDNLYLKDLIKIPRLGFTLSSF